MRNFINMLNESADTAPMIAESEMLEEGVRDQIEAIVDRVLNLFSPKHVTYEAACTAYDHVVEFTGDANYFHFRKEEMLIHGKLAKDVASTVVALSLSLSKIAGLGIPLTATIVAATAGIVGAGVVHVAGMRRGMAKKRSDREYAAQGEDRAWEDEKGYPRPGRSPAPVKREDRDETMEQVLANVSRLIKK